MVEEPNTISSQLTVRGPLWLPFGARMPVKVEISNRPHRMMSDSWFQANRLKLNSNKTNFCVCKTQAVHPVSEITLNTSSISRVNHFKLLGVIIDEQLSWKKYIAYMHRAKAVINKLRPLVNRKWSVMLYCTFFLLHPNFCFGIWGSCGKTKLQMLDALQHKVLKIILKFSVELSLLTYMMKSQCLNHQISDTSKT